MAHWEHRPEPKWKEFKFSQPYAKGLKRLREEVFAKTDFDPATLWQWGTMQAMALIRVLKDAEAQLGEVGQQIVHEALRKTGLDIGRQILAEAVIPEGVSEAEFLSYFATVINRIAYASLEAPRVDSPDQASFDILWCPHQDHYKAFDCRVQRYFVQGMMEAMEEWAKAQGLDPSASSSRFQVRFESTIPAGAPTCRFVIWRANDDERNLWNEFTRQIELKAIEHARERYRAESQGGKK